MDIEHDESRSRYLGRIDGEVASSLDYADDGAVVSMVRTFTNPRFRGRGLAAEITEHAVDEAEASGRRVRAMCWYVAEWFESHPDRRHLLA